MRLVRSAVARALLCALACLLLAACATGGFPPAVPASPRTADALDGDAVFARTLAAHGGDLRRHPGDINVSTDGQWHALVQRLQPIVSDARFRVRSEERYQPSTGLYAVTHTGPDGTKRVVRGPGVERVTYNGQPADDAHRRATAMTNDAFRIFHFGPTWFLGRVAHWSRLDDIVEDGRTYRRITARATPGLGEAAYDDAVLWIDPATDRLYRVHVSLNGFESTQGAHVDTTFLDYREAGGYLFPVKLYERVRGPVRIDVHEWHVTGLDLDRGWRAEDVAGEAFSGAAAAPARALDGAAR